MADELSARDSIHIQALWTEAAEDPDSFDLPSLTSRIVELVPCDYSSSNEIDELHARASSHYLPSEAAATADYQAFRWHAHEHPVLRRVRITGQGGPWRLSDFVSQRQWHQLGLYTDFFREMGVDYQAAFTAGPARATSVAAITFNRSGRDFDGRDMAVLRAARPVFQLMYRLAAERRRAAAAELPLNQHASRGAMLIGPAGHLEWAHTTATEAVLLAWGVTPEAGGMLPRDLLAWLDSSEPTLRLPAAGGVTVTLHRGPCIEDRTTVLFGIKAHQDVIALTAREQDVLTLVARGHSNRQIAGHLTISDRTVEKHLENAYAKLGVNNRTAAARSIAEPDKEK